MAHKGQSYRSRAVGLPAHAPGACGTNDLPKCILGRHLAGPHSMKFKTADLCDEFSSELQIAEPMLRHFGGRTTFAGPAATIKCFEDNSKVKEAVGEQGHGRVLVIDGGGSRRCALLGDLLAQQAADNEWAGVIVHGCIRDSADMPRFALGIMALASIPLRSEKKGEGQREIVVQAAGMRVHPGDWVYADLDGIVVASRNLIA
jgi:regulator of ribonuclease activity A